MSFWDALFALVFGRRGARAPTTPPTQSPPPTPESPPGAAEAPTVESPAPAEPGGEASPEPAPPPQEATGSTLEPAPEPPSTAPAEPIETPPASTSQSEFASKLVAFCHREWEFFRQGALKETDEPAKSRIALYWTNVGKEGWDGATPEPWSAAFISYAVKEAGDSSRFKKSTGHAVYINDAISHRDDATAAFQGMRVEEYAPKLGDLIARTRAGSSVTFDTAVATGWYTSHTDIVTAVGPGQVEMIGGNVSNSVTVRRLPLLPDGRLEPGAAQQQGVFAILRCNL